jgi:hypothetical protein
VTITRLFAVKIPDLQSPIRPIFQFGLIQFFQRKAPSGAGQRGSCIVLVPP